MNRTKLIKSITTPLIIVNVILLFMQIFTNILSKDIETSVMMNLVFTCLNALLFLSLILAIIGDKLSLMAHKGRIITLFVSALIYSGFAYLYGSRPQIMKHVPTSGLLEELSAKSVYDLPTLEFIDDEYWYLNDGSKIERTSDAIVLIYNPTCHLCQKSSSSYEQYKELAKSNNKQIFVANVATKVGSNLAQAYSVRGYPQMLFFKGGQYERTYDLFNEATHKLHTLKEITAEIAK